MIWRLSTTCLNDPLWSTFMGASAHNFHNFKMDTIMNNMEKAIIRVDTETQQGSVFDVVKMVLRCDSSSSNTVFSRLKEDFPQLKSGCTRIRINGKGQLTPVADAKTLIQIVMLLPGKASAKFRWDSAGTVCRVMGGDKTLLEEIQQNDQKWKSIEGGSVIQQALLKK